MTAQGYELDITKERFHYEIKTSYQKNTII